MKHILIPLFFVSSTLSLGFGSGHAVAAPSCADLAEEAGQAVGVPEGLLSAISLVETGTGGRAWPWTLNEGGKGMHFDTKDDALAYLRQAIDSGVTNIDVGCMQLNYKWHAKGFVSLDDMIDPTLNTRYAALFLTELQKRLGSWEEATANYHSADVTRGARYQAKVAEAMGQPGLPTLEMAEAGEAAPTEGMVSGMLLSGGQPLIMVSSAAEPMAEEFQLAALDMPMPSGKPVILRTREELPPRLGNRWAAIQAAREHLSVKN